MLRYNDHEINMSHFPDGTMLIKETPETNKNNMIMWFYENDEELVALMFLTKHLRANGVKNIDLVMPYVPNARFDRVKNEHDVFTLKYFSEIINSLNFNNVYVMDTHSSVTDALINNIKYIDHIPYIKAAINDVVCEIGNVDDLLIFYPDQGSVKRYADDIGMEYAFGIKNRDWNTGKILGLDVAGSVDKIKGKKIIIVDDICSKGGTFYHSAKKLKELGADDVYLYITHCENTIFEGELITGNLIKHIYTTDSLLTMRDDKITVFDVLV
jgi:ribose-phosphate pyrophosphokinase